MFLKNALVVLSLFSFLNLKSQDYPEMITVDGGTFMMGDTEMEGNEYERPAHLVTLSTFKIAKTETTVAQWKKFCIETGRTMPKTQNLGWIDNHPIVNISWYDAVAYCDWLSEKMDANYRLPTEAEWEYAARGGKYSKGTKYSGGRSMEMVGWFEVNSDRQTQPVATKKPNELGLYDMSGNVWEWCKDLYGPYENVAQKNPKGANTGNHRPIRGGGYLFSSRSCHVWSRIGFLPEKLDHGLGFRIVLTP
jgi:sulfatase modifying factor 1